MKCQEWLENLFRNMQHKKVVKMETVCNRNEEMNRNIILWNLWKGKNSPLFAESWNLSNEERFQSQWLKEELQSVNLREWSSCQCFWVLQLNSSITFRSVWEGISRFTSSMFGSCLSFSNDCCSVVAKLLSGSLVKSSHWSNFFAISLFEINSSPLSLFPLKVSSDSTITNNSVQRKVIKCEKREEIRDGKRRLEEKDGLRQRTMSHWQSS